MVRHALIQRPTSLLDDFFNDEFFLPAWSTPNHLDVYQENNTYIVEVDLPGFKKEDIKLSYNQDLLTITASHKEEKKDEGKRYVYRSRSQSTFTRQIRFNNIDPSAIDAAYNEGVLKVTLPILGIQKETKSIEVK